MFQKEVLDIIKEHGDKKEIKILAVALLDALKGECQLIKASISLLAKSDREGNELRIAQLAEILEMKADYGIEISDTILEIGAFEE